MLKPFTTKAGDVLETGRITADTIPAEWVQKAVLARRCGCKLPERFAFYALPDGRVAQVAFHPMNGADDMHCRVGQRDFMAAEYQELLDGERYCNRTALGNGALDVRRGRMAKACRVG